MGVAPKARPAQIRFLIALAVGIAVALLAPFQDTIPRILVGWNAGGWLYLILIGIKMAQAGAGTRGGGGGGFRFPGDPTPDYLDFLYFSFVVGTTNQTSDTEITSRAMRRVVTIHGILSFFFNTAVIVLINLASQLVQG